MEKFDGMVFQKKPKCLMILNLESALSGLLFKSITGPNAQDLYSRSRWMETLTDLDNPVDSE